MFKLTVVYFALRENETFDEDWYYRRPVAHALSFVWKYGCRRLEVSKAVLGFFTGDTFNEPTKIRRLTELWFPTLEQTKACVASDDMLTLDKALMGGTTTIDSRRMTTVERGSADTITSEVDLFEFDDDGRLITVDGPWASYFRRYLGQVAPPSLPVDLVPTVPDR